MMQMDILSDEAVLLFSLSLLFFLEGSPLQPLEEWTTFRELCSPEKNFMFFLSIKQINPIAFRKAKITLLHSERPKLCTTLAFLSAIELKYRG